MRRLLAGEAALVAAPTPEDFGSGEVSSIESLDGLPIVGDTSHKPQSKLWKHDDRWWCVLANASGTWVWRLDAASWTAVLQLSSATTFRADVKPLGDLVHIFLESTAQSQLASIEYLPATATWQMWSQRSTLTALALPAETETATLEVDTTGRLWVANDVVNSVEVRYSDAPYTSFSAPLTLVSNINEDDISVVTALGGGQIGVMWSNQTTDRFGFRVHADTDPPEAWSADEVPASQSAAAVGRGMADDHLNTALASDGTLYVAVKTSFNTPNPTPGYPNVALLIRRPSGEWDALYGIDEVGTAPVVVLNEMLDKVLVAYRNSGTNGPIVYRVSPTDVVFWSEKQTLIAVTSANNPTDTKQTVSSDVVILASHSGNLDGARLTFDLPPAQVVGRHVFYNNSYFDGASAAAEAADDAAIDTSKTALLPGQTASFSNYTGYTRGINGLMVDVQNLPGSVTAADFSFKTGNNNSPATWAPLSVAPGVTVRPGAGEGGSTRVTLIWPDGTIGRKWLEVRVLANANTGLAAEDVFYFGNALGEVGNVSSDAMVTSADEALIRLNFTTGFGTATVTSRYDVNKDRFVQTSDAALSRANQTTAFTALRLIAPPDLAGGGGDSLGVLLAAALPESHTGTVRRRR